jgi:hypothetical protein
MTANHAGVLDERSWKILLTRIRERKCAPFLGAGASYGYVPLGRDIARSWASEESFPLDNSEDLPKVAQFVATEYDNDYAKNKLITEFRKLGKQPDPGNRDEPYNILASLPITTFLTTNYDPFMVEALRRQTDKRPERELCEWNSYVAQKHVSVFEREPDYEPTVDRPIVFHLHGYDAVPESLVLTEDDYLDFLVNIGRRSDLLPDAIKGALGGSSLLFLGYSLQDLNFRVLFRSLVTYLEKSVAKTHISVQLRPMNGDQTRQDAAVRYLDKYYGNLTVRVYWGTCADFVLELRKRWEQFNA